MPRHVDHVQRRREISAAAIRILARGGPSALTLKSLAEELGGSITLVTHFFSTRAELFTALVDDLIVEYDAELAEIEEGADQLGRLKILVQWMLPLTADDIETEAGRIALIPQRGEHAGIDHFFDAMETRMRDLLRSHLQDLLPEREIDAAVALLRATTNGVVLSAVEHPDRWPRESQLAVVDAVFASLGLGENTKTALSG
jgi:AcrR family transcriptional regulator